MADSKEFFRRTPVRLRVASLLDHVGKNSPPDCFLPQTSLLPPCSNPLYLFLPMQKAGLATCFSFWRRARDFFGALLSAFASLRSLTTSAKTVHRTVFFRRQVCSLLVRFPLFIFANAKSRPCDLLFVLAESKGFFRRTPVHLRVASLLDHVGKNSPPDCFLPQTASAPSLFESLCLFLPMQKAGLATCFSFWRRARDSNPRTGFDLLHDFQSCSFGQLGQLSKFIFTI